MNSFKVTKDYIGKVLMKAFYGGKAVPRELFDLSEYFRHYSRINFDYHREGDATVAVSSNFRFGSIIARGRNEAELEHNIKDAILTSFDLPSAYQAEAQIRR